MEKERERAGRGKKKTNFFCFEKKTGQKEKDEGDKDKDKEGPVKDVAKKQNMPIIAPMNVGEKEPAKQTSDEGENKSNQNYLHQAMGKITIFLSDIFLNGWSFFQK